LRQHERSIEFSPQIEMAILSENIVRHRDMLGRFPRLRDQVFYLYGRVLRRFSWPLPCRRSAVQVRLRGQEAPFHLRLGSTDWLVLEEIFQKDEYTIVRDSIKDARFIVDLGANVGYSVRYWQTLFPKARILALEPEPDNFSICARNIGSAGLASQVTLLQAGVGARHGQMHLVDAGEGEWAYRTQESDSETGLTVEVLPLSEVLENHAKDQRIDLLKCDIEGAERELFEDCRSWIGRVDAIIIELHPPYGLADLSLALGKAGASFEISAQINRKLCPVVLLRRSQALR
jgi:FkbM family methyltransferase